MNILSSSLNGKLASSIKLALAENGPLLEEELANITKIPMDQLALLLDDLFVKSEISIKNGRWTLSQAHLMEAQQKREQALDEINKTKSAIDNIRQLDPSVEKLDELTEKAGNELKADNYDSAVKIAKQAEEEAVRVKKDYEASKEASALIFSVASVIAKIKSSGVKIPKSEVSIERAQSELNKNNFEKAKKLAKEAKRIASERKEFYEKALKSVSSASDVIKDAKSAKINVSSAEGLLNNAKSLLDEGKYEEAFEFSKQAKEPALGLKREYDVYKEAFDLISSTKSEITAINGSGVKTPKSDELIEQAKSELNNNKFERAKELANEARSIASERKESCERALDSLSSTTKMINDAKSKEINVSRAEELLNNARSSLDERKYKEAFELSKQAEEEALRLKREHEAYIEISNFISSIESEITEIERSGVKISKSDDLVEEVKAELSNNNFERAKELANEAKSIALEKKESYEKALDSISSTTEVINDAKRVEIGVSSAEELLNNAKNSLDEGKYEDAFEFSKQAEEEALRAKKTHEAYRETSDFISSSESEIMVVRNSGVKTSEFDELIERAKSELSNNNFVRAGELAREAKNIASERKESHENALNSISSVNKVINDAKSVEIDVSSAEELLNNAKSSLDESKYEEAFNLSTQAEEETLKLKKTHEEYIEASNFISSIESEITDIKSSSVKTPESDELIEQAKSELNKNNFGNAKELAKEAKKIALDRKESCEKALNSISSVDAIISDAKGYGMVLSNAEGILKNARKSIDDGEYEVAYKSSKEAERIAKETDTKYREVKDCIESSEATIEKVKEFCAVSEATNLLDKANSTFGGGSYDDAVKYAKQAEETAKRIREESKPEIEVELPEKTFKPNYWKSLDLIIGNKGNAHAKDVNIKFSEEVKIKGLEIIERLDAGEKISLEVSFKPVDVGERVPLEINTIFEDFEGKRYEETETVHINVGEIKREIPIEKEIDIKRETELFNGFIRLKMAVTNPMSQIITDVSLDLDLDEHTLRLDRHEPEYPVKKGKVQLGTISPGTGKTVSFYLDPMTCTKAGTDINCRVDYRDAYGKSDSIRMESKKVEVVCPIFSTESDINIGMLKGFIENLPYHDSKVYQIPTGLETNKLIETCRETIQMHDVRHIRTLRTKDDKTCETWYYGKTKVAESNIVIKASINEETKSIEIFAATPAPESLTGLLAELGHNLAKKIQEVGKKPAQVVNVSIKDTIIQRSPNLLNFCDMEGVCSEENIIVEDSVIQRSRIGGV